MKLKVMNFKIKLDMFMVKYNNNIITSIIAMLPLLYLLFLL
jgi:hypothetical protein